MNKRTYTMSKAALAARRKGGAVIAARGRQEWRTIRLHHEAVSRIRAAAKARDTTASAVVLEDVSTHLD